MNTFSNQKTSGNKGTNTPFQFYVLELLKNIQNFARGTPGSDGTDLHKVTDVISVTTPVELFPAVAGEKNIITDMLITNGDSADGTWVEIRETDASGEILWKGFSRADGGGFIQPDMKKPIVGGLGKKIVVVCTVAAEVVVCATGYRTS